MAGDFDGSDFVGIDDDGFGEVSDGSQDDTNNRPLSTGLENRLDGNTRFLQQRAGTVTYQFFSGEAEDIRPFTSVDQSALFYTLVPIRNDMKGIDFYLYAECDNDSATTGEVDLEARLTTPTEGIVATDTATVTESGLVEVTRLSLDLQDESLRGRLGTLSLWMQSAARSTPGSFTISVSPEGFPISDLTDITSVTKVTATQSYVAEDLEPVATCHVFEDANSDVWLSDFDFGIVNTNVPSGDKGVTELSYLLPQSLTVRFRNDENGVSEDYLSKNDFTMRAQQSVLGQHASAHGSNLDAIRTRKRPLAVGPWGEDEGDGWPTGQYRKWSWILEEGSDTILDEQTLRLTGDAPVIYCFAMMGLFRQKEPDPNEGEQFYREVFYADTDLEGYNNSVATADADLTVTVEQLADGDTAWSSASEVGSTTETYEETQIWPMTPINDIRLASQAWFSRVPGVVSGIRSGGTCATDYNYVFREGQIYEGDERIIFPAIVAVDLSEGPNLPTQADPVRATLEWGGLTNISLPSGENPVDDHQYHALCLSTMWFEEVPL